MARGLMVRGLMAPSGRRVANTAHAPKSGKLPGGGGFQANRINSASCACPTFQAARLQAARIERVALAHFA